jgi:hypothetical protein
MKGKYRFIDASVQRYIGQMNELISVILLLSKADNRAASFSAGAKSSNLGIRLKISQCIKRTSCLKLREGLRQPLI